MRTHLRRSLLCLLVAVLFPLVGPSVSSSGALTVASCPDGTHWDSVLQVCR